MKILPLSQRPLSVSVVANWYHDEWGYMNPAASAADIENHLKAHIGNTDLPQTFIAVNAADETIGAAELKLREVKEFPDYEFWLGGVYVHPMHRGKGIASRLALYVAQLARENYDVSLLYLQTEKASGGLYSKLGWSEANRFEYDGSMRIVMVREL